MKTIFTLSLLGVIFTITMFALPVNVSAATSFSIQELPRTGNQPQVISQLPLSVTELPRTGIPAIAWDIAALVPVGAKLLNRRKSSKKELSANSVWTEKQLKRDL